MKITAQGALTAKAADTLSGYCDAKGYDVLYDHGPKKANVGTIVIDTFSNEGELSARLSNILDKAFILEVLRC